MYFKRIRNWAIQQEEAHEVFQWGCSVFKFRKKVFAICSLASPLSITLKPQRVNVDAYLYHPAISIASHVGRFGWVNIKITDKQTADLALSLVGESYKVVSGKIK